MEQLYCEELRFTRPRVREKHKIISEWIQKTSEDDVKLMSGQLTALITGVPEFLLRIKNHENFQELFRASYRETWNKWSKKAINFFKENLTYEESFQYNILENHSSLGIQYQITMGEFDRIFPKRDKLSVKSTLSIPQRVLSWVQKSSPEEYDSAPQTSSTTY